MKKYIEHFQITARHCRHTVASADTVARDYPEFAALAQEFAAAARAASESADRLARAMRAVL